MGGVNLQVVEQHAQGGTLVNAVGQDFEEIVFRAVRFEGAVEAAFPEFGESYQGGFVVADEHHLAGLEIDGDGKLRFVDYLQSVEPGFGLDVRVVGGVGDEAVAVVGEYGEVVFARFLFEVGQHFGVDAPFKHDLAGACVDDLAAVVCNDVSAVGGQVELPGHGQESVGRPSGGEHERDAGLLGLDKGLAGAGGELVV